MGGKKRHVPLPGRRPASAVVRALVRGLVAADTRAVADLLADDIWVSWWRWDGSSLSRGRDLALASLLEWARDWPSASMEAPSLVGDTSRAVIELSIAVPAGEAGPMMAHNICIVGVEHDAQRGRLGRLDIYCALPVPSSLPPNTAPVRDLNDAEIRQLLADLQQGWLRRVPPEVGHSMDRGIHVVRRGSESAAPEMNSVRGASFDAADADDGIDRVIRWHQQRGRGFCWFVHSSDSPKDLGERLQRRGFERGGTHFAMACRLDELPRFPDNHAVAVEPMRLGNRRDLEQSFAVAADGFGWTREQRKSFWDSWSEHMGTSGRTWPRLHYLAYDSPLRPPRGDRGGRATSSARAIGYASLSLCSGTAQLTGAATMPAHRRRGVYTALLAERLREARRRGYHIASIGAGEMSKLVVERWGFKEYAATIGYVWMPELDLERIRAMYPTPATNS